MNFRPLPIYGATDTNLSLVKEAKRLEFGDEFFVKPAAAAPGVEGVVLAFAFPPFCPFRGYANVSGVDTADRMRVALRHVFGLQGGESKITQPAEWLTRVLGKEVREIEEDSDGC